MSSANAMAIDVDIMIQEWINVRCSMWECPDFEIIETCAEITAYIYQE